MLGQSLGGAIAIDVLSGSPDRERFRLLVADSPPASLRRVAREALDRFWLTRPFDTPLSWTIADDWRPIDRVAGLAPLPLLLIAGTADPIVNADHARDLYAAAREPKEIWLVDGLGHIQGLQLPAIRQRLLDKLATLGMG